MAWLEYRKAEALKAERDRLVSELNAKKNGPRPVFQKPPYDASAREMLAYATSQWPMMLTALETVEVEGATPVALEIAPLERWIRVEVEFTDYATLLRFVDELNAGESAPRWTLVQARMQTPLSNGAKETASVATVRGTW